MSPLLSIQDLRIDFLQDGHAATAVQGIDLQVAKGEILALVGESGSGKSVTSLSLLQLLPKDTTRYSGNALFTEEGETSIDLISASARTIRKIRGHRIAMIFQEPMTALNPVMRCGKQVAEVLQLHKGLSYKQAKAETIRWFEKVRLPDPVSLYDRYPHEISGGQKQRVMIAMAMCCEPSLLICDEPTTALDVTVQKAVLELIRDLQKEINMGVIFITHDLGVVAQIADRVAILYKGRIIETGATATIFAHPQQPYTKALIACRPSRHPKGERLPVVADFLEGGEKKDQPPLAPLAASTNETLVEVKDLVVRYKLKKTGWGKPPAYFNAVDGVSFSIRKGETVGLIGESGCGKTTLGRALLKLVEPSSGSIRYADRELLNLGKEGHRFLRKEVQLIFQDPYSSLNPRLTIGDAISEPMQLHGNGKTRKERREKTAALLQQVGLPASAMNRYPHQFSGGQRQRIVIARALSVQPDFIVCDESVSALDVSVQAQVLNLLNELKRDLGLTLLFISHDLSVVRYMCDRALVMHKGKIIESGVAEEVYLHPQHHYTRSLIEAVPNL